MARKLRIEYPSAVYHVMCRGNRMESIYLSDQDREIFLKTLGEACEKTGWIIHAYVMMSNHYHLLLETPETNLVAGMKWFQGTYTQRFNARNKVWGHLFQGRYKALPIDGKDRHYFRMVSSYIHLNPLRARILDSGVKLNAYAWSSYPAYLRPTSRQDWLKCSRVLRSYELDDDSSGRSKYRRYMQKRCRDILGSDRPSDEEKDWEKIRKGWCFGSDEFKDKLSEVVDAAMAGRKPESHSGGAKRLHHEKRAEQLVQEALACFKLNPNELKTLKKSDLRKQLIAWLIRKHTPVGAEWIAEKLWMGHRVSVSQASRRIEESDRNDIQTLKKRLLKFTD